MENSGKNKEKMELVINGQIWIQVESFRESESFDRHFMVKRLENGHEVFVFGNGKQGSRPGDLFDTNLQQTTVFEPEPSLTNTNNFLSPGSLKGIYRAVIVNNEDPDQKQQLHVKIDAIPEMGLLWAAPILPGAEKNDPLPAVGDIVWVSFRNGDPNNPVWLGKIYEDK